MKLGKESRYAMEGLMVLARQERGTYMQLREIADAAGVPATFLAKTFQKLNHAQIVTSSRGAVRGYTLARRPQTIKVLDVVRAVEGIDAFDRCLFWSDRCADSAPCPMHLHWQAMRRAIAKLMQRTSLADLLKNKGR